MNFLSRIFGKRAEPDGATHRHGDMVSLVALMPSWEEHSLEYVRGELDALFPGEFLPPREVGNFVLDGPVVSASYMVQCTLKGYSGMYLVHNVPGPYSEFSDFLAHVEDPELAEAAARLPCWMSVDLLHAHAGEADASRFVSTVLAQLAPGDAELLVHPGRSLVTRFTPQVRRVLAAGGEAFGNA